VQASFSRKRGARRRMLVQGSWADAAFFLSAHQLATYQPQPLAGARQIGFFLRQQQPFAPNCVDFSCCRSLYTFPALVACLKCHRCRCCNISSLCTTTSYACALPRTGITAGASRTSSACRRVTAGRTRGTVRSAAATSSRTRPSESSTHAPSRRRIASSSDRSVLSASQLLTICRDNRPTKESPAVGAGERNLKHRF